MKNKGTIEEPLQSERTSKETWVVVICGDIMRKVVPNSYPSVSVVSHHRNTTNKCKIFKKEKSAVCTEQVQTFSCHYSLEIAVKQLFT
jgi:hypothetical protein